jgi:hypothetical protein
LRLLKLNAHIDNAHIDNAAARHNDALSINQYDGNSSRRRRVRPRSSQSRRG